jgi:hypothetical protein
VKRAEKNGIFAGDCSNFISIQELVGQKLKCKIQPQPLINRTDQRGRITMLCGVRVWFSNWQLAIGYESWI